MTADEERIVEEVAQALFGVTNPIDDWTAEFPDHIRDWCRRLAVAAITAYRATQDGGAEEAVRRVEAVAAELEGHVQHAIAECDEWGGDELARWKGRLAAYATSLNLLRAALAPQAGDGAR